MLTYLSVHIQSTRWGLSLNSTWLATKGKGQKKSPSFGEFSQVKYITDTFNGDQIQQAFPNHPLTSWELRIPYVLYQL